MNNSLSAVPCFFFHSSRMSRPGEFFLILLFPIGYPDKFEMWWLKFKHFQVPGLHDFIVSFISRQLSAKESLPETLRKVLRTGSYNLDDPGRSSSMAAEKLCYAHVKSQRWYQTQPKMDINDTHQRDLQRAFEELDFFLLQWKTTNYMN